MRGGEGGDLLACIFRAQERFFAEKPAKRACCQRTCALPTCTYKGVRNRILFLQYYDDAAGILRMVILSAIQPHRLLAAPPLPVSQHPCEVAPGEQPDGSQHGHMHYNMSLDDMRSQVAGEDDRCAAACMPRFDFAAVR